MKAGQQAAMTPEKKPRRRVKKVKGHGGHHGGAWKVAYADFVTAMMALFLVLWLVSQADVKLKESIANYFKSPGVFSTMKGGILSRSKNMSKEPNPQDNEDALMSAAVLLRKKFQKSPEFSSVKDQVKVEVTEDGLRIQILDKAERVSFTSGSAELTESARQILTEIATSICDLPNPIFIGGHTDRHVFPNGSSYTNWELSADRANAARRYLEHSCVKPDQIRRVVGYADTELLYPSDPFAPGNRRISITVTHLRASSVPKLFGGKSNPEAPEHNASAQPESEPQAPKKSAPAAPEPQETPVNTPAKRLNESKLRNEGVVPVGEPDQLPPGVRRSKAR
ncbi:MAG: OmpA family protein [Acidobacteria bacterium]|nr:OmpA family protein [Acidobacteriota bacterium]MBI3426989.1 OmpA family protein [Acidobacteriota bacterium]